MSEELSFPKNRTVMLVDDNDMDNEFHEMVILETGIVETVLTARNGLEALQKLKETASTPLEPALILLDINMPVMDGFEFLSAFKELSKELALDTKVIVMLTTSLMDRDKYGSLSIPSLKGYLIKPLTEETFMGLVKDM